MQAMGDAWVAHQQRKDEIAAAQKAEGFRLALEEAEEVVGKPNPKRQ